MNNTETLSGIIIDWAKPMIDDIASQLIGGNGGVTRVNSWIKKILSRIGKLHNLE